MYVFNYVFLQNLSTTTLNRFNSIFHQICIGSGPAILQACSVQDQQGLAISIIKIISTGLSLVMGPVTILKNLMCILKNVKHILLSL